MPIRLTVIVGLLALSGCTSHIVVDASSTPARRVDHQIAERQLLDVGVVPFAPGLEGSEKYLERKFIEPEVRKAESAYLAYNLRNTLEATENWGAVRILPRDTRSTDLTVYGEIVESTGIELELRIRAVDATGDEWFDKSYSDVASQLSYRDEIGRGEDAFQDIYNQIADDLLDAYLALTEDQISRIRTTAMLRFAEDISPYAFDDYISEDKRGRRSIDKLPAEDDPMLARVRKIREREYMFIDLLDEHYDEFHASMTQPYSDWRRYTYQEILALRDLRRAALAAKILGAATVVGGAVVNSNAETRGEAWAGQAAVFGGVRMIQSGFQLGAESSIHAATLTELADSFRSELAPLVVEVEGKTTTLEGTAEQQFDEWRRLLREIYESETGIDLQDDDDEPALPDVHFQQD